MPLLSNWINYQSFGIYECLNLRYALPIIFNNHQRKPLLNHSMNFFSNLFKGQKTPEMAWDKISFKINLSDRIPQYYQATNAKDNYEQQLTCNHPLYAEIFPEEGTIGTYGQSFLEQMQNQDEIEPDQVMSPHKTHYWKYIAKENDTISGLAIRLDLSEKYLRELNNISGVLYPGMVIKIPKFVDKALLEEEKLPENIPKVKISELLQSKKPQINIQFNNVDYMAGLSGNIRGTLMVNSNYILFTPDTDYPANKKKFTVDKLLKFNVLIEICDVQHAESIKIPEIDEFSDDGIPKNAWIVQIMLYRVGDSQVERKYREKIKKLKLEHKALASISFSFQDHGESEDMTQHVVQNINKAIDSYEKSGLKKQQSSEQYKMQSKIITKIPFFDIIQQSLKEKPTGTEQERPSNIIRGSAILGTLTEASDIITIDHFQNLAKGFPMLCKLYNWEKAYSIRRDGSAFSTFLNKIRNVEPSIMLIKQYKGNILGAFLVDQIQAGKTGRGEMFIFTFRGNSLVPEIYEWTTKNEFFVNLEKEVGIGIGMGMKYGIFVDRTFQKGSSASTLTFGNSDMLSKKQDFLIDEFEIWGVDTSF